MIKIFDRFITEITGLKMTIDTIDEYLPIKIQEDIKKYRLALMLDVYLQKKLANIEDEELNKVFNSFVTIKNIDVNEGRIAYSIDSIKKPKNASLNIEEAHKCYTKAARTMRTTNNSFLVTALIIFETAFSELLKKIISKYYTIYLKEEKVEASKIINSESIENLKQQLINDKVSVIMRQNIFEWLKILQQKQKIEINYDEKMKQFIEGYYRRNIIVHNDGIVNEEYLDKMNELGIETKEKLGDTIDCSMPYVNNFIECSIYMLITILYECIKLFKEEINGFLDEMEDYTVDLIVCENYDLSTLIFKKLSEKKLADEQHMTYIKLNYWQSKKWNNQFEEIKEEVENFDVSAKEEYIKLGKYALLDDFDSMISLIKRMSNNEETNTKLHYTIEEWPIFKKFKESIQYKSFVNSENNIISADKTMEELDDYKETQELIDQFEPNNLSATSQTNLNEELSENT